MGSGKALAFGPGRCISLAAGTPGRQGRELRAWKRARGAGGAADASVRLLFSPGYHRSPQKQARLSLRQHSPCRPAQRPRQARLWPAQHPWQQSSGTPASRGCPSAPSRGAAVTHPAFFGGTHIGVQHREAHLQARPPEPVCPRELAPAVAVGAVCRRAAGSLTCLPGSLAPLPTLHPIRVSGLAFGRTPSSVDAALPGNADPWADLASEVDTTAKSAASTHSQTQATYHWKSRCTLACGG